MVPLSPMCSSFTSPSTSVTMRIPAKDRRFVKRRHVLLIARQAVEGLGDNDVELAVAGVGEQTLIAGSQG